MKPLKLLSFLLLIALTTNAQRIDSKLRAQFHSANVSPKQLDVIEPNLIAAVFEHDSLNFLVKLDTSGKIINIDLLGKTSENKVSHINFNKVGFDIFYRKSIGFKTTRTLVRVNQITGNVNSYELMSEDSIFNEPFFAFGTNKFVWFNHYLSDKVSMVVGIINDTGNASTKTYPISSHYIELSYVLGSTNQFIAYFNKTRYLLSIDDSLGIDTVALPNVEDKRIIFNEQQLRTVDYMNDGWYYTTLLNNFGDTVLGDFKFNILRNDAWLYPINNSLWVVNIKSDSSKDSLAVSLFDKFYHEQFTKYPDAFLIKSLAVNPSKNEIYLFGKDSNGLVLSKVNSSTFNTGLSELQAKPLVYVYPNPVSQTLYLNLPSQTQKINIYTSLGTLVLTTNSANQIDVSTLINGLYLIEVLDNNNQRIATTRILKQ